MSARQNLLMSGLAILVVVCACSDPDPEYSGDGLCIFNARFAPFADDMLQRGPNSTIRWVPDGARILFEVGGPIRVDPVQLNAPDVYAVHVSGSPVRKVLDLPPRNTSHGFGLSTTIFDLSADGSRIAYATCAVSKDSVQGVDGNRRVYNYEIFVSDLDGTNGERLTNNTHFDVLPAWSPDGESLAFISDPDRSTLESRWVFAGGEFRVESETTARLTIHTMATGESREIGLPEGYAAAPIRLEWSPSGDRIAFVVLEGQRHPWNLAVYVVGADGTGLTRVSDALSGPTWSPDGEAIAMYVPEEDDGRAIYTFPADGSNPVRVHSSLDRVYGPWWTSDGGPGRWYGNLSWSPDGSAILVERFEREGGPAVIQVGTAGVKADVPGAYDSWTRAMTAGTGAGSVLASPANFIPVIRQIAAWSPDGSRIAVRYGTTAISEDHLHDGFLGISVFDRLGENRRDLVRDLRQ